MKRQLMIMDYIKEAGAGYETNVDDRLWNIMMLDGSRMLSCYLDEWYMETG